MAGKSWKRSPLLFSRFHRCNYLHPVSVLITMPISLSLFRQCCQWSSQISILYISLCPFSYAEIPSYLYTTAKFPQSFFSFFAITLYSGYETSILRSYCTSKWLYNYLPSVCIFVVSRFIRNWSRAAQLKQKGLHALLKYEYALVCVSFCLT